MIQLSIILVGYGVQGELGECLNSVQQNLKEIRSEIILVWNCGPEDRLEAIRGSFPDVVLIENKENVGFSRGCNQGLKNAKGRYVLFLNPDTIIKDKETLSIAIKYLESNQRVGILGIKLINPNGSVQPSCNNFPTIENLFLDHILRIRLVSRTIKARFLYRFWYHDELRDVDWILGAFMMMKHTLADELGGFDEDYFLYGEDLDICYRAKQLGAAITFLPSAEVMHKGNQQWDRERLGRIYHALVLFYRKHYSNRRRSLLEFLIRIEDIRQRVCRR